MRTNKHFLSYAIKIGDILIENAVKVKDGWFWQTWRFDKIENSFQYYSETNLYSGNAGISLFLLRLYQMTKKNRFLKALEESISWLKTEILKKEYISPGLFNGDIGVLVVLYEYSKAFDNIEDKFIIDLLNKLDVNKNYNQDIIIGSAGSILGLLSLYNLESEKIKPLIEYFVNDILSNIKIWKKGTACSDNRKLEIPLLGFSHGQSGIAFSLSKIASLFSNSWLKDVSNQLLKYENEYFCDTEKNYPDLRSHLFYENPSYHEIPLKLYKEKYFNQFHYMDAWCHGYSGILLSKIERYKIFKDPKLYQEIQNLSKNIFDRFNIVHPVFCLCHGLEGNLETLLQLSEIFKNDEYNKFALKIAHESYAKLEQNNYLNNYSNLPQDFSLLTGISGIGYQYLRLINPKLITPILSGSFNNDLPLKKVKLNLISKRKFTQNLTFNGFKISTQKILDAGFSVNSVNLKSNNLMSDFFKKNILHSNNKELLHNFISDKKIFSSPLIFVD